MERKNVWISVVVFAVLLIAAIVACVLLLPETDKGAKTLTVSVIIDGVAVRTEVFKTDAEYLADALIEEELIGYDTSVYGIFIHTVSGIRANDSLQQWWCVTKGGEQLFTGASETPVADGDAFELTLVTGW